MKRVLFAALALALPMLAQIGVNPAATLSWYSTTYHKQSLGGYSVPMSSCFDGTSLWVANADSSAPWLSRVVNGSVVSTTALTGASDNLPATACDPADGYVWVADQLNSQVFQLNTNTMALTTFPTNLEPTGLAFDGTNIEVAEYGNGTISAYSLSGVFVRSMTGLTTPHTIAVDNKGQLWATSLNYSNVEIWTVATGLPKTGFMVPSASTSTGLAFDGTNMWVAGGTYNSSYAAYPVNPTTFHIGTGIALPSTSGVISLAVTEGPTIWAATSSGYLAAFSTLNNSLITSFTLTGEPVSITYAGSRLFVGNLIGTSLTRIY